MSELSVNELEQIAAGATGVDYAKRRKEDREAMKLVRALEDEDAEVAADSIDEALIGWRDDLTGLPPQGMEGPRFRSQREIEFMDWIKSPAGADSRAIRYPKLDEAR